MPITYIRAPSEIIDLIDEVKAAHHPALQTYEVAIDALVARRHNARGEELGGALKAHGYPAVATISIMPLKRRALGNADALLVVDGMAWEALESAERRACIDHELEHLRVVAEEGGVVEVGEDGELNGVGASDDFGRPRLKLRLHDWQLGGFRAVAKRHHEAALEVVAVRAARDEKTGQMFWDWPEPADDGTAPLPFPEPAKRRKAAQ